MLLLQARFVAGGTCIAVMAGQTAIWDWHWDFVRGSPTQVDALESRLAVF
jgi:hypothetical protein